MLLPIHQGVSHQSTLLLTASFLSHKQKLLHYRQTFQQPLDPKQIVLTNKPINKPILSNKHQGSNLTRLKDEIRILEDDSVKKMGKENIEEERREVRERTKTMENLPVSKRQNPRKIIKGRP